MEEKLRVNVYEALPIIFNKIKVVALASVLGKKDSWLHSKMRHNVIKGRAQEFYQSDLDLLNATMPLLGDEILQSLVVYDADREVVVNQVKELAKLVSMPYIYGEVLGKKRQWYDGRVRKRSAEGKASSFKEEDIHVINKAAMQIANELKSTEFIL